MEDSLPRHEMSIIDEHYAKSSSYVDTLKDQINNGMYEHLFFETTFNYGFNKKDLVFLDIGANIGLVSIYAIPFCKRIVAVEPSPEVFPVLVENTKYVLNIEPYQYALAPRNGEVEFFVNDINSTASSTVNTYGALTHVKGRTLISMLQEFGLDHVDVAKFDCEGAEGESLDYLQLEFASHIIKTLYIETHNDPKTGWEHKLGTICANLARLGYHKQIIDGMAITATRQ